MRLPFFLHKNQSTRHHVVTTHTIHVSPFFNETHSFACQTQCLKIKVLLDLILQKGLICI